MYGHDDMINYLSDYRTQDRFKGKHYYPSGALCWFETNQHGDPTGSVYYIKKVPDMELLEKPRRQRGFKKLIEDNRKEFTLKEKLTRAQQDMEIREFVKPKMHQ